MTANQEHQACTDGSCSKTGSLLSAQVQDSCCCVVKPLFREEQRGEEASTNFEFKEMSLKSDEISYLFTKNFYLFSIFFL